jgi:hypothetical protein
MPTDQHEPPRVPDDEDKAPDPPNEGSPGHRPSDDDSIPDGESEDRDSEHSFPASDPPANY